MVTLSLALLAFLLGSFVARNGDLWMHLARGRLLAHGQFSAADSLPAAGERADASWLYDLACYGVYSLFGGPGLVVCKALVIVVLAVVLLRLSRTGPGVWVPAFCTILALLAMSLRLLLQPVTVSYLFLALTLCLLQSRDSAPANRSSRLPLRWPLLLLFAVWANTDGWFVLGLGTAALVWAGELLDEAASAEGMKGGWLASVGGRLVCLALLAGMCLLNPAHVHAFVLPPELRWYESLDASTSRLAAGQVTSPFQRAYYAHLGLSPAGLAYFPLLALSALSFLLTIPRWNWRRFLPWLGLALLSVLQVRTVPFFAVVAGPVLAWNIQDFFGRAANASRWETPRWRRWIFAGHFLTGVLLLILPVCAWPSWLQGAPYQPRRWAVETPSSLEGGAAAARDWLRGQSLGREARGLHLSSETASAFAWFCPEEKGVQDASLASTIRGDAKKDRGLEQRLRDAGINHVIVYETDRTRFYTALGKLMEDPQQWPLLCIKGNLAIFGWRDPAVSEETDPFRGWELDLNRLAFHPADDRKSPEKSLAREPKVRLWWEAFWKPIPPRPVDQEEATLHLFHADALRRSAPRRRQTAWQSCQLAALIAASGQWTAPPAGLLDARLRLSILEPLTPHPSSGYALLPVLDQMAHAWRQQFYRQHDDTAPALPYLAVRAARRALTVNPDDAQAYLVLGESYLRLLHDTRERVWAEQMPELLQLRRCQASAALNQAIYLKPSFAQAHLSLSRLYGEMGYLDLTLEHLRTYAKLMREAGPPPGVSIQQFLEQQAPLQDELSQLAREVEKRTDSFVVASAGWKVGDRAVKAFQEGLAGKARDLLLESDIAAFGPKGMSLELELLLRTGRPRDVRDWIGPEQKAMLGTSYHWLRAQAHAALGEYPRAREECNELAGSLAEAVPGREAVQFREVIALLVGKRVLGEGSAVMSIGDLIWKTAERFEFHNRLGGLVQSLKREADVTVLRGLLALEEGDADEAEIAFREAVSVWKDEESAASGAGLDFNGRALAQNCLRWLQESAWEP
jgi:tetratricopeptide (TPR) repeat protein